MVDVFGNILDTEFENNLHIFKEKFVEAMETHNLNMTPKSHVLTNHVPKYVRRTVVPLEPTSELESQYTLLQHFLPKIRSELYVPFLKSRLTF